MVLMSLALHLHKALLRCINNAGFYGKKYNLNLLKTKFKTWEEPK
jgi:hypothetical protein